MVDFDNDQATSVLAPFSGPVSRLLVSPGDQVKEGQPLAVGRLAGFRRRRRRLSQGADHRRRPPRRVADADKDLSQHNGVSAREAEQAQTDAANAEADRDAALQASGLAERRSPDHQGHPAGPDRIARIDGAIRSPIAGTVVEKLITPGQLLQAGTTPAFTVANLSRVWVMAQIFDADLAWSTSATPPR